MARLPKNLVIDISEVSQSFDLSEITGVDLTRENDLKNSIAQAIIDKIVSRYKSGVDIRGNAFAEYAPSYKKSETFEAFGKSSSVNMTLTNDMSAAIKKIEDSGGNIKIGWNDSTNNAKAFNHMTGDTVKKRQFFGINQKDLKEVISGFREEISTLKKTTSRDDIISRLSVTSQSEDGESLIINVGDFFG